MTKKALFLVGLLASADSCWQTQTNATQFQVTTSGLINSCPQRPTITLMGPQLESLPDNKPAITLIPLVNNKPDSTQSLLITDSDVRDTTDDAARQLLQTKLEFTLPRELLSTTYQVYLTLPGKTDSISAGSFVYSTKVPAGTMLTRLDVTLNPLPPTEPAQVVAWHPKKGGPIDLAVIGKAPVATSLTYYHPDPAVAGMGLRSATGTVVSGVGTSGLTLQTGNLAVIKLDESSQGVELLAAATTKPGAPAVFQDGLTTPKVATGSATPNNSLRAIVVGGHFQADMTAVQVATFNQGSASGMPYYYSTLGALDMMYAATPTKIVTNPNPLAVATGYLSPDPGQGQNRLTDTILIVSSDAGTSYVLSQKAGSNAQFAILPQLDTAVAVAIGKLDNTHELSQVVFGRNAGKVADLSRDGLVLYTSTTTVGAPTLSLSTTAMPLSSNAATAIAITDYDGDGYNDIVYTSRDGVHVLVNQGTTRALTFTDMTIFNASSLPVPSAWSPSSIAAADFSGDSRPDFIITNNQPNAGSAAVLFLTSDCPYSG